ncbi:MAG TPA: hypothetical protein VGB25_05135 [Candidatus Binatia bacterium]
MSQQMIDGVARRLERLERANRNLKSAVLLLCAGLAAVVVMGQAEPKKIPKELDAENFILRAPNGAERGRIGTSPEGNPYMVLLDANGRPRVALGRLYGHVSRKFEGRVLRYGTGPGANLYDKEGKPRKTGEHSVEEALRADKPEPAESLLVLFDQSGNVSYAVP